MAANKKFTPRASSNLIEEEEVVENKKAPIVEEEEIPAKPETPADVEVEKVEKAPIVEAPIEENSDKEGKTEKVIEKISDEETEKVGEKSITFIANTESKPIERMVKIRLAKKYDGCVGGVWYHFAKDETVVVPENLKRILSDVEGMLKPL